jgi:hypothetical protein
MKRVTSIAHVNGSRFGKAIQFSAAYLSKWILAATLSLQLSSTEINIL